jgi:hypothetical protein
MESDWKKFSAMVPRLREKYLALCNAQVISLLTAGNGSETERFWDATARMEKEVKVLRHCLDNHSRSKMSLSMLSMIRVGMLTREDLAEFSDELQKELSYAFSE